MKILWFNWRDIKNPEAGGAEVLTHELAKRLIKRGHSITLLTAKFDKCSRFENLDGVSIIREGGKYTVYSKARKYYESNQDSYDVVIDEINVRPFLTPKYVKGKPIIVIIHQVSPEQFLLELPFPISYLGYYYLEKKWLSNYKETLTVTISNSTKEDIQKLGFTRVAVMPVGISVIPLTEVPKKSRL